MSKTHDAWLYRNGPPDGGETSYLITVENDWWGVESRLGWS